MLSKKNIGYITLLMGIFLIASNFLVGNFGKHIPSWQLAFFRFSIAFIVLAPFILPRLGAIWPVFKKYWYLLVVYGILGITIPGGFSYLSLRSTTVINGAFIFASAPIITLIFSWLIIKEKLTKTQWLGVVITLLGVLVIICQGDTHKLLGLTFGGGDLWMLDVAISWALYTVLIHHWKVPLDLLALLVSILFFGTLAMLPFCIFEWIHHDIIVMNLNNMLIVGYAGIFAGAIAYFMYNYGLIIVGPNKSGLLNYTMPAFATIQAYFILDEKLHLYDWGAFALIISGIMVTILFSKKEKT